MPAVTASTDWYLPRLAVLTSSILRAGGREDGAAAAKATLLDKHLAWIRDKHEEHEALASLCEQIPKPTGPPSFSHPPLAHHPTQKEADRAGAFGSGRD